MQINDEFQLFRQNSTEKTTKEHKIKLATTLM